MDISNQTYQQLAPEQRAVLIHSAVNRMDQEEIDRLTGLAPTDRRYGQAILGMGQAMNAYNIMISKAMKEFLLMSNRLNSTRAFCAGWIAAGGAETDKVFLEKHASVEVLELLCAILRSEVEAIRQAARMWCEQNSIPLDFFSGPTCFLPLAKRDGEVDEMFLKVASSVFSAIKLAW